MQDDNTKRRFTLGEVRAWRDAALAEGWSIEPTYPPSGNSPGESVERAARMRSPDGYLASLLMLPKGTGRFDARVDVATVHVWCPRKIGVLAPMPFDGAQLRANARRCERCGATDIDTVRVAFANRACAACAPKLAHDLGADTPGFYE